MIPLRDWPLTRDLPRWTRVCAVHARAVGYHHGRSVRALVKRIVERALGL